MHYIKNNVTVWGFLTADRWQSNILNLSTFKEDKYPYLPQ